MTHPMTPFKAQGANQAISDAVLLAESLADGVRKYGADEGFDKALPTFEQKMLNPLFAWWLGRGKRPRRCTVTWHFDRGRFNARQTWTWCG